MLDSLKDGIVKAHDKEIQEDKQMREDKENESVAGDEEYYEEEEVEENEEEGVEETEEDEEDDEEDTHASRMDRVKGMVSDKASNVKANVQGRIQEAQSIRAAEKAAYNERKTQIQAETYVEKEAAAVKRGQQKADRKFKGKTPVTMSQRVRQVADRASDRFEDETGATRKETAFGEFNKNKGSNQGFIDEISNSGPKNTSTKSSKLPNKANAFDAEISSMSTRTIPRTTKKTRNGNGKKIKKSGGKKKDIVTGFFGEDVYKKRPMNNRALDAEFDVKSGGIFDEFDGKSKRGENPFERKTKGGNPFDEGNKGKKDKRLPPEFI